MPMRAGGPRILGGGCTVSSGCPNLGDAAKVPSNRHSRGDGAFNVSVDPCARGDRRKRGISRQSTVVRNYG